MSEATARTSNAARTLAIFHELKREREIAQAKAQAEGDSAPPVFSRVRLASGIDLSKADPECSYCGGLGRRDDKIIKDRETGETVAIPVICRCVKRRGGIAKDQLDRMREQVQPGTDRHRGTT